MIIAVDGGTTNTRLSLVSDGKVIDRQKFRVGLRNSIHDGTNSALANTVKNGITELLSRSGLSEKDVRLAAFSGMISSESGLHCVKHISAPSGVKELSAGAEIIKMPEISSLPLVFIPGVKTFTNPCAEKLDSLDVMRGEETELIGIISALGSDCADSFTAIMPGSHMKTVELRDGKIMSFRTSISGELIRAAAENTILASSLGSVYPHLADEEFLLAGYDYAEAHGINEALFKIRIQANFLMEQNDTSREKLYAFLIGALLRDDIRAIAKNSAKKIIVAGSDPFRSAITLLLHTRAELDCLAIPDKLAEECSAVGADMICGEISI